MASFRTTANDLDQKVEWRSKQRSCQWAVALRSFSRTIPELMISLATHLDMSGSAKLPSV
ncbi:hypothetical protein T10_5287 [Trichinella papuae]|uniref:Uncharacterized protein n=1 Tax=Trichinella papuae TaxID=268474 RepID=A0A0V1MQY9_9BILA|nr:hypothetical protein T10_5287 [Trichinella papuae]